MVPPWYANTGKPLNAVTAAAVKKRLAETQREVGGTDTVREEGGKVSRGGHGAGSSTQALADKTARNLKHGYQRRVSSGLGFVHARYLEGGVHNSYD